MTVGRQRLAAYARMAELLHSRAKAEAPGATLELPPVVLLTGAGVVCGKVTSVWGYLARLQRLSAEDGPARATTEALLTDPSLNSGPVALHQVSTIYLVDASVSPPGNPHLRTRFGQLSVSIADVVAWTLDNDNFHTPVKELRVEEGGVVT